MIGRNKLYLIPGLLGILAILIGVILYPYNRLTFEDMHMAFGKLAQIPLQSIRASGSSAITFNIPSDARWADLRRDWGEPRYVILIDRGPLTQNDEAICLDEVGIKVELYRARNPVELQPTQPPYGYSFKSFENAKAVLKCCMEFQAVSGETLKLSASTAKDRSQPAAGAELCVVSKWPHPKDSVVGVLISDDLVPICRWLITSGCLFVFLATAMRFYRSRR